MPGKLRSASKSESEGAEESMETLQKPSEKVSLGALSWVGLDRVRVADPLTRCAGWPGLRVRKGIADRVTVGTGAGDSKV